MVLFNRLPCNVICHLSDSKGHWLMVVIEQGGVNSILLCIYGYNQKTLNRELLVFLKESVKKWRITYAVDRIILGGDFNLAHDLWLDRSPPKANCHCYEEVISDLISELHLTDYWRWSNPHKSQFTWFSSSNKAQCSRLDYWLISNNLINNVSKCDISVSPLTDHCAVLLSFSFHKSGCERSVIWKFNNSLLEN